MVWLISMGADVEATTQHGETPLHLACRAGQTETVLHLVQQGAKANCTDSFGSAPVHVACSYGHAEIARVLLRSNADIRVGGRLDSILDAARAKGFHDIVALLTEASSDSRHCKRRRRAKGPP